MATDWTPAQKEVIDHRKGNLLVAAAAGSGKTAVLSERILEMLKDKDNPTDVDRLLIVTFTKAAAAEMKERIAKKLSEYVEANPEDTHMRKQGALLNNASISTIDSFCNQVVREYFHVIDLDPSFSIADDSEIKRMQAEILEELTEELYSAENAEFARFSKSYAGGKTDEAVGQMILSLYEASQSDPYPLHWLMSNRTGFNVKSPEELDAAPGIRAIQGMLKERFEGLALSLDRALQIANEPEGPEDYIPVLTEDRDNYAKLAAAESFTEMLRLSACVNYSAISRKKKDPVLAEKAKNIRDAAKKTFQSLRESYLDGTADELAERLNSTAANADLLTELAIEFTKRFDEAKKAEGIFSFNDIEHFALWILAGDSPDSGTVTVAAENLRDRYDAIVVDEYQDSNRLQETILNAISGANVKTAENPEGMPNIFMVGDVKQSIYRFRRAEPRLFMEKYDTYPETPGNYRKIVLKNNFRSRRQVLDLTNVVFEWAMHKQFGGIEYDKDAALYAGNNKYEDVDSEKYNPELILVKRDNDPSSDNDPSIQEAYAAAEFIKRIMAPGSDFKVMHDEKFEKPLYSDIAILLRSPSAVLENYTAVLSDEGIPVRADVKNGFFKTGEVKTIFNYLRILSNPLRDIPLAAVLYSPMVGLDNQEMAELSVESGFLYERILKYLDRDSSPCGTEDRHSGNGTDNDALKRKLGAFLETYRLLKTRSMVLTASALVEEIYEFTGFYKTALSLPQGRRRAANLDFFLGRAREFEAMGNVDLTSFLFYLENLEDRDIDYGEAAVTEGDNAVRIMSIHGSKGLEFPVVIICQMLKGFNMRDTTARVVVHPDLGPALDHVDLDRRTRQKNPVKAFYAYDIKTQTIAEEMRIFYVALTRAREKLVMIGAESKPEKLFDCNESELLEPFDAIKINSYFQMLSGAAFKDEALCSMFKEEAADISALYDREDEKHWFEPVRKRTELRSASTGNSVMLDISLVPGRGKPFEAYIKDNRRRDLKAFALAVRQGDDEALSFLDPDAHKMIASIRDEAAYVYPFEAIRSKPVKYSVSQLKHAFTEGAGSELDDYDRGQKLFADSDENPKTRKKTGGAGSGARRGTAIHRVMELLPFDGEMTEEDIRAHIDGLVEKGLLSADEAGLVSTSEIFWFTGTEEYRRMCRAHKAGKLFREQAFTFGIPAEGGDENDLLLIQGVMDAYFEENGRLVLLDYKTDRAAPDRLRELYHKQLEYYAEALMSVTGMEVSEKLICSFTNRVCFEV